MADRIELTLTTTAARPPGENGVTRLIGDLVEDGARDGLRSTLAVWPVRTGRSKAGFRVQRRGLVTFIKNAVPYSGFVRRRGAGGDEARRGLDETKLPRDVQSAMLEVIAKRGEKAAIAFIAEALRSVDRG